jgi:hypothetical protein
MSFEVMVTMQNRCPGFCSRRDPPKHLSDRLERNRGEETIQGWVYSDVQKLSRSASKSFTTFPLPLTVTSAEKSHAAVPSWQSLLGRPCFERAQVHTLSQEFAQREPSDKPSVEAADLHLPVLALAHDPSESTRFTSCGCSQGGRVLRTEIISECCEDISNRTDGKGARI